MTIAAQRTNVLSELDECLSLACFLNLASITIMGEEARHLPEGSREVSGAQLCFWHLQEKLEGVISTIKGEQA